MGQCKIDKREWKCPEFAGKCPNAIDWARLAAYIDGEGCVIIYPRKRDAGVQVGFYLRLTVANTDVRLLAWLKETFGGVYRESNSPKYYVGRENRRTAYCWKLAHRHAAWALYNCLPYFIIKLDQAQIGIQLQESMATHGVGMDHVTSDEMLQHRAGLKRRLSIMKAPRTSEIGQVA